MKRTKTTTTITTTTTTSDQKLSFYDLFDNHDGEEEGETTQTTISEQKYHSLYALFDNQDDKEETEEEDNTSVLDELLRDNALEEEKRKALKVQGIC